MARICFVISQIIIKKLIFQINISNNITDILTIMKW